MASPIAQSWLYATMLVENQWGERGTGFLVNRPLDQQRIKVFLVTNKHVLNGDPTKRLQAQMVRLHLNAKNADGTIAGHPIEVPLSLGNGLKLWREHPDRDVDVLAFDVTQLFVEHPEIERKWADYSLFADAAKLEESDVTIGEEVLVIGYPLGLRHRTTNFPLVRGGIIATRIGESLEDDFTEADGTTRRRILRGFLIDGATIPGSSGSPVVLKPATGRFVKGNIIMGLPNPLLLGILAETRYAPVRTPQGAIPSFAGLGLAFDALTVKETIESFFS